MPFIVFEKPDPIYYPGDTVSGRVLFETSEPISARSIIINITGFTATWNINWCERNCRKFLFKRSMVAWVSPDGTNQLPMGIHEFPFSTVIPKDCPPTFKGSNGENKYEVEVLTDVPWRFTSKARMEFTVNKKLVLPEKYWTDEVTKIRNIKSGYIFNEGPISVKMTLPKVVFQIGDSLRLRLDINNTSSSEISRFSIHFFRLTHYHSRHLSVPCKSPMNCPMCPSSRKETRQRFGKISDFDFHVASHSEGSKVIDLGIPMEATTPSFESGLMTMRYYICSYVWVKNGLPIWCGTNKIYIGEKKEKIKKPSKGDAPPDYTP